MPVTPVAYLGLPLEVVYIKYLLNYLYLSVIYINMLFWELPWWEIVAFVIAFGVFVYLIIKAPASPDSTKKCTSSKCTSNKCTSSKCTSTNALLTNALLINALLQTTQINDLFFFFGIFLRVCPRNIFCFTRIDHDFFGLQNPAPMSLEPGRQAHVCGKRMCRTKHYWSL